MASAISESSSQGNESEQSQAQQGQRSKLVQRLLDAAPNLPAFINDLLTTQAITVAGTEAAGFLIERQENNFSLRNVAHIRPDESTAEMRQAALQAFVEIIQPCVAQGKDGAIEVGSGTVDNIEAQYCLVTLLRSENEVVGVSAVITRARNLERARQRLMSMQLVAGYFELYSLRRNSEQARVIAQSHQHVLQLATAVATAEGFESAAMNLCNELATHAGAARVALGWVKGVNVKVKALSHTEQFDKKQELVVQLQNVMEECADQEAPVMFDPNPDGQSSENVTRSAAKLSREHGGNIVLSLPLRRHAEIVGVVTFEFLPNKKLGPQVASALNIAVDLLAPQLYDRYQNDRYLITKAGLSMKHVAEQTLGPKYWLTKIIVVLAIFLLYFISPWSFYKPTFKVTAPFQFVPIQKQTVSVPFEGLIDKVHVRPGQLVKKGDPLLDMKTEQIRIDLVRAEAEANTKQKEYLKLIADPTKVADANIALAQKEQALAKVKECKYKLDQAKIVAPIDGEVLKGDLVDRAGAAVKLGDMLFEIARRDNLEAELEVAERDIQELRGDKGGYLVTNALPTEKHRFKVDRIIPLGEAKEGGNVFKVYAVLDQNSADWRPGMKGEAKVEIDQRSIAWIWSHRVIDFIRMKVWL